uniref:Uncharacterized protein n=1 Tax=Amphimedon queenslandica TaxID=400682 RepID=A0A1X7UKS1_AMPQE
EDEVNWYIVTSYCCFCL